jgi:phosphomannomutase
MHAAEFNGVRLALANDPDADRLAVSEWQAGETEDSGHWYAFTGNEIGILLANWLWEQKYKACLPPLCACNRCSCTF